MIAAFRPVLVAGIGILLLLTPAAGAQRWQVGGTSGVSATRVDSPEFEWASAIGASGAFFQGDITDRVSVLNEILVTRRRGVSTLPSSTLTLVADYVELPLMAQVRLASVHGVSPFVTAGPSVTLRTRCRFTFVGGGVVTDQSCDEGRYQTHSVDFGANVGAGVSWTSGLMTLSAEGRYAQGIRDNVLPTGVTTARASGWAAFASVAVPLYRSRSVPPGIAPSEPAVTRVATPERMPSPPRRARVVSRRVDDPLARRISLEAADMDLREFFDRLAQASGVAVVVAPQIRGRVTISLTDVTIVDALASVVDRAGLAMTRSVESGSWVVRVGLMPRLDR